MLKWIVKSGVFLQLIFLVAITLALWIPAFMHPKPIIKTMLDGPIYDFLINLIKNQSTLQVALSLFLIMLQAFALNWVLQINGLFHRSNFIACIVVVLSYSWNPEFQTLHPILVAGMFVIAGVHFLLQLYGKQGAYREVFSASFAFSLASLFYFPLIYLLVLVWFSFITLRISEWREYVISIVAFLLPYIYYASGLFWNDNFISGIQQIGQSVVLISKPESIGMTNSIWLTACALALVISLFLVMNSMNDKLLNARRKSWIFVNFIIVSFVALFLAGWPLMQGNYLFIIPISFFFVGAIVFVKRTFFVDFLLLGLLVIFAIIRILPSL